MFPPLSGVVRNWRVHSAVCSICGVHDVNTCVKSRKLKVRCMKMRCLHWHPYCPGISLCLFWQFVEFPANSLTNSVTCMTVLLLWQRYCRVQQDSVSCPDTLHPTNYLHIHQQVFWNCVSNCFYILWSYVCSTMDARFKSKKLGDLMGIERDKILLGVHLLSFCSVHCRRNLAGCLVRNIPH